MRKLNKK